MSNPIISVENISKKYIIGENINGRGARTFRDIFDYKMRKIFSKEERKNKKEETTLWALKDISFEVNQGDVVGIIGRNGAGKSTLLKILSRITEPTSGRIKLKGRVASLLEVGTGFSQELTGRENIYLNGSILGMRKFEIDKRFDEIVAFSEIEKFIDTPVKRYSSGMYVRLAFAIAAHLEPEILIVDEVLAVGDAEFQKKCLGKMKDVSSEGRTVLFVSHNLAAINQLCDKGILLNSGKIIKIGDTNQVIDSYLNHSKTNEGHIDLKHYLNRTESQFILFEWIELRNAANDVTNEFSMGDDLIIVFKANVSNVGKNIKLAVEIKTTDGFSICNMVDEDSGYQLKASTGEYVITVKLKNLRLYPGVYYIGIWAGEIASRETYDYIQNCISFAIVNGGTITRRNLPRSAGIIFFSPIWREQFSPD